MKKEIKIILASAIVIIGCIYALNWKIQNAHEEEIKSPSNLTREFNHKMGPDTAKVKLVEFYDPECEACAAFFPYVKDVMKQYEGKIQLTVRYALYHGSSLEAAKATEAAGKQGKFWEYQAVLFEAQGQWSHRSVPPIDLFEGYATNLGLNLEQFKKDMNDPELGSKFGIDAADGKELGVQGTPTIFINGVMLDRLHPTAFREKIEEALK